MELKRFEVRELIKAQEKAAVGEAEQLLEMIQKEIAELQKSETELDQLSHIEDPVHFLQVISFISRKGGSAARSPMLSSFCFRSELWDPSSSTCAVSFACFHREPWSVLRPGDDSGVRR